MSRGISSGIVTLLNALGLPSLGFLVSFDDLGVRYTNLPSGLTFGGAAYTAAVMKIDGLGENILWEAPGALLEIGSVDLTEQTRFFNDTIRGTDVTIIVLYASGGSWLSTGWSATYTADAESVDSKAIRIRLSSEDAVGGTEVPRRTTQEHGCQHDFQRGGCYFRWVAGTHAAALKACDKGYDTPNGCKVHFPDLTFTNSKGASVTVQQTKPYGAFLGGVDHRLVLGGR